MTSEIEIEIEVKDFVEIEKRLLKAGAKLEKQFSMRDAYFDKDKFYRNVRIRLRRLDRDKYLYTVKSPSVDSKGVQFAEESESQGDGFEKKFNDMSLKSGTPVIDEELNVKRYSLGLFTVELREVKGLFNYVELTSPSAEKISMIRDMLDIQGSVLARGALNRVLQLRGLPEIAMKL
jgi:adenylate cyclase class IV